MRALITASFDPAAKARLERHMAVVHEDWKVRNSIYFDGAEFAKRITDVGADVLIPAWKTFTEWLGRVGRQRLPESESRFFMLTVYAVVLVYLLDSRSYQTLLGGSVRQEPTRGAVRDHIVRVVVRLLAAPDGTGR